MNGLNRLTLLILIGLSSFVFTSCQSTTPSPGSVSSPSSRSTGTYPQVTRSAGPRGEFRGVWVYDPRRFEPDDVVKTVKDAGFNAVFVRMSSAGAAYYPSSVLPKAENTDRDYAQEYIDAGKKYGVKIHAWHVCFMMHNASASVIKAAIQKGEVMRDTSGKALRPTYNVPVRTPALLSNRQLEKKAMLELTQQYDFDGVQFDYIRYFSPMVDFSPVARAGFEKSIGSKVKKWPADVVSGKLKSRYKEWKATLVSSLVKEVSEAVHAAKPGIKVSAAVWHSADIALNDYCQDWGRWVQEGYLDFVVPMDYTPIDEHFTDWIEAQKKIVPSGVPLYAGIGSYMLNRPEELYRQIELCRQAGLPGYVLYNYDERLKIRFLPDIPN